MSKSVKHEKTHGYLDDVSRVRKHRKFVRSMKTQLLDDIQELLISSPVVAQDY